MASKVQAGKKSAKVGPNIVRAWFDTVINPLIRALEVEKKYLEKKDWTWRFGLGSLEAVRPVQSIIGYEAMANLEQIFEFYPAVEKLTQEHEEKREELLTACKELYQLIRESPELQKMYDEATSEDSLSKHHIKLRDIFPDGSTNYKKDFLTEYIVNDGGEFSSYIMVSSFWREYREVFLAILDSPGIHERSKKTIKAGEALLKTVEGFIGLLKELRKKLSSQYDVPPYVYTAPVFAE
ncbi:MAG: hypothetical protein QOH51_3399 [Acidobacteriota bacterium]|jgi:hypothetical protein|nr:hypothetical protein [Acidobacteriota bacterium]